MSEDEVLAQFGLEDCDIESIEPLGSYRISENAVRVRTAGRAWVLKRHTSEQELRRLALAHPLEERLASEGFPVAPLRRSVSGQTLVRDGSARYSLHGWIEGRQLAISDRDAMLARRPDLVVRLASMLGALHRTSAALDPNPVGSSLTGASTERLVGPQYAVRALRRPRMPRLLSRWQSLRLTRHKSEFDQWILQVLPEVADSARRLAGQSLNRGLPDAAFGLIHNDINWENLVFDDRLGVAALLDFDNAIRAPWIAEVGAATVVLIGTAPDRVDTFVTKYEDVVQRPVNREALRLAMALKCTQSILNSMNTYLRGDVRDVARLSSWCRHLHTSLVDLRRA